MIKNILIIFCIGLTLIFTGCTNTSICLSQDDTTNIIEFIEYSNNFIENTYETNPTDDARRAIEPYRARYRFIKNIIQNLNN